MWVSAHTSLWCSQTFDFLQQAIMLLIAPFSVGVFKEMHVVLDQTTSYIMECRHT